MVFILTPKIGGEAEELVIQNRLWRPIAERLSAPGAPLERLGGRLAFHGCGAEVTAEEGEEIARFLEAQDQEWTAACDAACEGGGTKGMFIRSVAKFAQASGGFEVF